MAKEKWRWFDVGSRGSDTHIVDRKEARVKAGWAAGDGVGVGVGMTRHGVKECIGSSGSKRWLEDGRRSG